MDHMPRRQLVSLGDFGFTSFAPMEISAFRNKLMTCRAMNRTINTATAQKGTVGSIDNGIYFQHGDIGFDRCEIGFHRLLGFGVFSLMSLAFSMASDCSRPAG